jgi:dihydroorotase
MVFSERSRISSLQSFVSDNARKIYPVTVKRKMVSLVEDTTAIPETYGTVVPMWAGRKLPWRVTEVTALPEDAPHP